jgi:REP element-mobilizing transposase RayT
VTKCRRPVFTDVMLTYCEHTMHAVCAELDVELVEFNGEADHVHLLVAKMSSQGRWRRHRVRTYVYRFKAANRRSNPANGNKR